MSSFRSKPELVKLFYRIGEVATIVGVQPHVLRYWETEFRTIRPQKSNKGQRIYSRRDVEKLIKVKDLLRNQGFTIAGARKVMRDQSDVTAISSLPDVTMVNEASLEAQRLEIQRLDAQRLEMQSIDAQGIDGQSLQLQNLKVQTTETGAAVGGKAEELELEVLPLTPAIPKAPAAIAPRSVTSLPPLPASQPDRSAKRLRKALVELRQEVVSVLADLPPGSGGGSN
jgi:DNA-binding transcriptional MerR regulator